MDDSVAIVRAVGSGMVDCELTFVAREGIDVGRAEVQHRRYCEVLEGAGMGVRRLAAEEGMADGVFVEDAAVVLDEVAVVTRPGAESRRGEVAGVARALEEYREVVRIEGAGTLDGGDVLRVGRTVFVGRSMRGRSVQGPSVQKQTMQKQTMQGPSMEGGAMRERSLQRRTMQHDGQHGGQHDQGRTNDEGFAQLAAIVGPLGYEARQVGVRDCLHLKTAVTALDEETLLVNPQWVDEEGLRGLGGLGRVRWIEVAEGEPFAGNTLTVGGVVYMSARWPRTRERVERAGFVTEVLDISEFEKAEGGLTCLSLIFRSGGRGGEADGG